MASLLYMFFPALAFVCIFLYLLNTSSEDNNRVIFLRAALLFAGYLVLALELLSLVNGVTRFGLVSAWFLLSAGLVYALYRYKKKGFVIRLPVLRLPGGWMGWAIAAPAAAVLVLTFVSAWLSPPLTWDSLTYHMSRVAHWAQNRSVGHYITGIERQNSMGPAAEMLILNTYVLVGGDRLASFVQWFAMLGSLAGVSLAARRLGASNFGQWLAVAFAITLPMGIAQASNTVTDYVTSFWVVCTAVECLNFQMKQDRRPLLYAGLAAGLALLTKATSLPFLIPFALWTAVLAFKNLKTIDAIKWGAGAVVVVFAINAGFLSRNLVTYGHLSNPVDFEMHANQFRNAPGWLSSTLKHAGMHAGLPFMPQWNAAIDLAIQKAHTKLDLDVLDPRTTYAGVFRVASPARQEDLTTNPAHAYLILGSFLLMLPFYNRFGRLSAAYTIVIAASFLLFSYFFKWQIFSSRLHLPFFVLSAPVVGVTLSSIRYRLPGLAVVFALFIFSIPWLVKLEPRPLLLEEEAGYSLLSSTRERLYFGKSVDDLQSFEGIIRDIQIDDCSHIGLMLWGDDPEYLFWSFLKAPREDLHIEWIVAGAPSVRYKPADFQPCAIICRGCAPEQLTVRNLPFQYEAMGMQVFINPQTERSVETSP